ncbi:MAG: recombination protein RecR [Gammaproteobacteria bacterium]|nr:recombination protein RecR [Gammaproteobacteria bacterium]
MRTTARLQSLIDALQVLPGVGPKSAQRMALALLQKQRPAGLHLAEVLATAMRDIRECRICRNYADADECEVCRDPHRDPSTLCIVESPADVFAIEHAGGYHGHYFVMHGRLSPIEGIGPEELGLDRLARRVEDGSVSEAIVATNATVEGEATAHYIRQLIGHAVPDITRLAQGMPVGGELEYTDGGTILHALRGRRRLSGE